MSFEKCRECRSGLGVLCDMQVSNFNRLTKSAIQEGHDEAMRSLDVDIRAPKVAEFIVSKGCKYSVDQFAQQLNNSS